MAEVGRKHSLDGEPLRKKLKVSDLPISQTKRAAIDNLMNTFRKKGPFDQIRRDIYSHFEADVSAFSRRAASLGNITD